MPEPARWRPRRSTVLICAAMAAAVAHSFLERVSGTLAGLSFAAAMVAMLEAGLSMRKEEDG